VDGLDGTVENIGEDFHRKMARDEKIMNTFGAGQRFEAG